MQAPKQIQQRQMTQHQISVKQMSNPQFTRQHGEHQHGMTIANPQKDRRQMGIPSSTFEEDSVFKPAGCSGLPFQWLRTWIFSLLALVALPLGGILILMGFAMQDSGDTWTEFTAEVTDYDEEEGIDYRFTNVEGARQRGTFGYELDNYVTSSNNQVILSITSCDLLSRFWIPQEDDATFSLWVNPEDSTQISCIPVSADSGAGLILGGFVLLILSAIRLLRTINAAATKPSRATA